MTCRDYDIEQNANKIHRSIKHFEEIFPEELAKTDIKRCGHCNATGLETTYQTSSEFFCFNCGGTGYVGYEKIQKSYTCRLCNGSGCSFCDYCGMTDWITHAMGSDIAKAPKGISNE